MSRKSIQIVGFVLLFAAGCGSTKAAKEPAEATAKALPKASAGESVDHGLVRDGERLMVERAKKRGAVATPAVAPATAPVAQPVSVPAR
jgi:hypothetical protein